MRRWHPDKFLQKLGNRIVEEEREEVAADDDDDYNDDVVREDIYEKKKMAITFTIFILISEQC